MESTAGGRGKKLIRALETAELLGRPTCSECTDAMMNRRGCKRPGENRAMQGTPWVYTSPALQADGDRMLYECPVGMLLREMPHLYDVLDAAAYTEAMSPTEYQQMPVYMQRAFRVVQSERNRLQELRMKKSQGGNDAAYGARLRSGK